MPDAGAYTTTSAITRAECAIADILARCCTLSLAQLIAAVDEQPAVVIDAVLDLVARDAADLWRHGVDGHLVVGRLPAQSDGSR
ncbi:hypothetical protein BJF87_23850 [Gordonia sp. CNJ-863]|nr:hypothetical protein BJF87_23850 [Gordonia sp. CNJ-863]